MRVVGCLFFVVSIYGCGPAIQVGPKNFELSKQVLVNYCLKAKVPPPLAKVITIRIAPGMKIIADDGGETLLRQYAALSTAIRSGKLGRCSKQ
jgi:hypothetical protein